MTAVPAAASVDKRAELRDRLLRKRRQEQQNADHITAEGGAEPMELSSQQAGLWLDAQLGRSSGYGLATAMRLRGPLDVPALRLALSSLISRHESLRTSFVEQDGQPRLLVAPPPGQLWWEELDLSQVPEHQRARRALQLLQDCCDQVIDLRHPPLLRVFLIRLAGADHVLGYVLHHIVGDGWSMPILAAELNELYLAAVEGRPPRLPAHPIQPSDVYRWQRRRLSTEAVQQRLNHRRDQLAGLPQLRLPTDRPRSAIAGSDGRVVVLALPSELIVRADALARATGRTPFAVLVAGFAVLLQQRSGQHDLAIGTAFSGRVRTEMESLIGFFANTGVLRIRTTPEQTVDELIGHCHDCVLEAQQVQDIPFTDLVNTVAPARVPGANPLFQICFTLARGGVTFTPLAIEGVEVEPIDVRLSGSRFDLTLQVTEAPDGSYALQLEYATELFDESTVLRLGADYRDLLEAMLPATGAGRLTVAQLQQACTPERAPASCPAEPPAEDAASLRDHLARIWAEVFDVTGAFDDEQSFFEVGGTSIMAVRLRARILSEFGIDIELADIFAGGSVAELVCAIEAELLAEPAPPPADAGRQPS